ncbi:hypothetical protein [Mucilaginibacter sp. UYCu711]|uniref:hypothetical protein n=1 Tax=Mucilaginibacter sp. UYCu711 TaxID=3156339 RepID=UPI003D20CE3A
MKKINSIIEKVKVSRTAYCKEKCGLMTSMPDVVFEIKQNIVEAYNLSGNEVNKTEITPDHLNLKYNWALFFHVLRED